eukprot:m.7673 g.7673  ORF g.7673 m.7673 type:complete len:357 (-) comp8910_c0_seq1:14-1084(-)
MDPNHVKGRLICWQYTGWPVSTGVIRGISTKNDTLVVEFPDRYVDRNFPRSRLPSAFSDDHAIYEPKEWLLSQRGLGTEEKTPSVNGSRRSTRDSTRSRATVKRDAFCTDEQDALLKAKRSQPLEPDVKVRDLIVKVEKDEEMWVQARVEKGGSRWLLYSKLDQKTQQLADKLPLSKFHSATRSSTELIWLEAVLIAARTNMDQCAMAFDTDPQTITLTTTLPAELVGEKEISELPHWVPRIVGKPTGTVGGAIVQITTRRVPVCVTNYGHGKCRYCAYKVDHGVGTVVADPHMVDVWCNSANQLTTEDCRCSAVYDYESESTLCRYMVSVVRQLDNHRGLMRARLEDGVSLDDLE